MADTLPILDTPEECEQYALNVEDRFPELARQARRRGVELRAKKHGAATEAEEEALQAVYAYERVLTQRKGRSAYASRTWQMIKRRGILPAVERAVSRPAETAGYTALAEMGMADFAFENVVCRHPTLFSEVALKRSRERLAQWNQPPTAPD